MSELEFNGEIITSRQNPTVKRICALLEKKTRRRERLFRFDGIKLLCEALSKGVRIELIALSVAASDSVRARLSELVAEYDIDCKRIYLISEQAFEKMTEEASPEGIITVAASLDTLHLSVDCAEDYKINASERLLLIESMRDPGNLGTVIRSAAALGIDRLIISDDCAELYNPKTVRAAMGGLFGLRIDVVRAELFPDVIRSLRLGGRELYATALSEGARRIDELSIKRGDAFIIGNEGHGLSLGAIEASSGAVVIPMAEGSESLNAAAAAAICIWETVRAK